MRGGRTLAPSLGIALLALVLAGCVGDEAPGGPADDTYAPPALEDPAAALAAGNATSNLHLLGNWDDGGNQEIDAWGDFLFVMKNPRVVILNVSNLSDIQQVGEITLPGVKDVKVSYDGNWAFVGNADAQGDHPLLPTTNSGFYVLDVSDKTNPVQKSFLPVGPRRGPHMVFYHRTAAGDELVFGANADVSINRFDRATGTLTELSRYGPNVVTDWNRDVQVVDAYYQGYAHDMFVMDDPVQNKTLMYVANWDAGLRIVDVSDPANPQELGKWMDFPDGHAGNLHTVSTLWIGDRRITVGSPEIGFYVVGGYHYAMGTEWTGVYIWDTTDPANIRLLGTWSNPRPECAFAGRDLPGPLAESITSSHNVQLEAGRVYLAHYDCGVWVLDVSTAELQAAPQLLAYHDEGSMHTWDVIVHRGAMMLGDATGIIALHFPGDMMGEAGLSSRA